MSGLISVAKFSNNRIPVKDFRESDFVSLEGFNPAQSITGFKFTGPHPLDLKKKSDGSNNGCICILFYTQSNTQNLEAQIYKSISIQALEALGALKLGAINLYDEKNIQEIFGYPDLCPPEVSKKNNPYIIYCNARTPFMILYINQKPQGFIPNPVPWSVEGLVKNFIDSKIPICTPGSDAVKDSPGIYAFRPTQDLSITGGPGTKTDFKVYDVGTETGRKLFLESNEKAKKEAKDYITSKRNLEAQTKAAAEEYSNISKGNIPKSSTVTGLKAAGGG